MYSCFYLLIPWILIHRPKAVPAHTINALKSSRQARKFMSMLRNVHFKEMKLISQWQPSLTNWLKRWGCSNSTSCCAFLLWEDLKEQKSKPVKRASTLTILLGLPTSLKLSEKRLWQEERLCKKIKLANGQIAYILWRSRAWSFLGSGP